VNARALAGYGQREARQAGARQAGARQAGARGSPIQCGRLKAAGQSPDQQLKAPLPVV
jgi:hypothetical protein